MIGRVLSHYKLLEEVGHGGMAVVYRGEDTRLHREVAVKVLHPHLANLEESRARLEREAQAVAKLHHDNILEIFDYSGPDTPERFLVTEFIHGQTLSAFLADQPLELPEVAEMIVVEVTAALEHAHHLGVIHRDIKPENVMIRRDGLIKLTDFGIAQIVDKEKLTMTGQLLGSPAYMAPENVEGGVIDFRTDVFAVGILLYQLATGKLPFSGKNPHEVLKKIVDCRYPPPDQVNPLVGRRLVHILQRALARRPEDRFADVGDLRRELLADLAEVGLADARCELKAYFRDRGAWVARSRKQLVATLAERGRAFVRQGRTAAALSVWGRGLAVSPGDPVLLALIDSLSRRRRHVRWMVGAGLGVLLTGGALWAARLTSQRPPHAPPAPATGALATGATTAARNPPPAEPTGARAIAINTFPKDVDIYVDKTFVGRYDGSPVRVSPGPHRFTFRSACCVEEWRTLGAQDTLIDGGRLVRLRWRSARVTLRTMPQNADIQWSTERRSGYLRGGETVTLPFPEESQTGQMDVRFLIRAPGYLSRELHLQVAAGASVEQPITLARRR
ncbi:MAG TPA: serine/threonine-protein kinase [Polyangia bacterium]|nr:serine/threonine-protein kinase [Polyangia bacterium]